VYSRNIAGKTLTFGVSGLLYKSNVLMYDHQTESLWSQVKNQAVTGPMTGTRLQVLPSTITTWKQWQRRHPDTVVLSLETGHVRDYSRDPYENYYRSRTGLFGFFRELVSDFPGKEVVAGVLINDTAKAYPLEELRKSEQFTDRLGDKSLSFAFDQVTGELRIIDQDNQAVPYITAYWFVWKEIHPDSELFRTGQP
jgi:hypothetical protein